MPRSGSCSSAHNGMRSVSRPAVYIGFTYFGALLLALFLGETVTPYLAVTLLLAFVICMALRLHRRRPAGMLMLLTAGAAMTVFSICMLLFVRPTERYIDGEYRIQAVIESEPERYNGNYRYTARVHTIEDTGQSVDFAVRLSHGEALEAEIGDTVTCTVRFVSFWEETGLSSRAAQLADQKVFAAYITDYAQISVTPAVQRPFAYYCAAIRAQVRDSLLRALPRDEASVLSAMLLGLRGDLSDTLNTQYRAAGASHILVISGMHMAIISQFALGALCLLGIRRRYAAGISIAFILAFMAVSGMSATVVRSGIMQIILLFGILIGRTADTLNSLAIAMLVLSVLNPFCVGDVSLLLSFSATLGILLLSPRMLRCLTSRVRNTRRRMWLTHLLSPVVASLSAILGSLPVQLYVFGSINFSSILTSALVLYASAWLIRFGVLAAILLNVPLLGPAAAPFVFLSGLLSKYQNTVVRMVAEALPQSFYIAGPYAAPAVLVCVVFLLCGFRLCKGKQTAVVYGLAAGVLAAGMLANAYLNAGCAQLLVLRTPLASCVALVENGSAAVFQCSGTDTAVAEALRSCGAQRIELLHVQSDEDAVRCAQSLATELPVSAVLYPDCVYWLSEENTLCQTYSYATEGMLNNGASYQITADGNLLYLSVRGCSIAVEQESSGFPSTSTDILITDSAESLLRGSLTILDTEDTVSSGILEQLPAGRYLLTGEHERICLRFDEGGHYTLYGG